MNKPYIVSFKVKEFDYALGCETEFDCNQYTDDQDAEKIIDSIKGVIWGSIKFIKNPDYKRPLSKKTQERKLTDKQDECLYELCQELIDVDFVRWSDRISETQCMFFCRFNFEPTVRTVKSYYFDVQHN